MRHGNARVEDLQTQADIYREIAEACLSHPGCTAIQTWGFTDKYSWIGSHSKHTQGAALPFDRNYRPKPAYQSLRNALESGKAVVSRRSLMVGVQTPVFRKRIPNNQRLTTSDSL